MTMRTAVILSLLVLSGCGGVFAIRTPTDFVELDPTAQAAEGYDLRTVSADGVVLAVRAIGNARRGSGAFWTQAIRNQLRRAGGYALIDESEVRAASGETGRRLRFGRDAEGHTYRYWVAIFTTDERVFVIEAGGRQDRFNAAEPEIEAAFSSFRIR